MQNINDMNEYIQNIKETEKVYIKIKPTNKQFLFVLGILFAAGKKISILNKNKLDLTSSQKSFSIMSYVWDLLSDNSFPNKDFTNVKTDLEIIVENFKRIGLKVKPIINNSLDNKIFLICPVRNATDEQRREIEQYTKRQQQEGFIIHAPHLHTVQKDLLGGYSICLENANAIATSSRIDIYYDQKSTGSVFDLGVAYYLEKPLNILNKDQIDFKETDFIDNLVKNWPFKANIKTKKLIKD